MRAERLHSAAQPESRLVEGRQTVSAYGTDTASEHPGTLCFSRPVYSDGSARPTTLEFGVMRADGELWLEVFDNA